MSSDPINDLLDLAAEQALHLEVNGGVSPIPCPVKAVQWKHAIKRVHEYRSILRKGKDLFEPEERRLSGLEGWDRSLIHDIADRLKKLEGKADTIEHNNSKKNVEPMRIVLLKILEIKRNTDMLYAQPIIQCLIEDLFDYVIKEIRK